MKSLATPARESALDVFWSAADCTASRDRSSRLQIPVLWNSTDWKTRADLSATSGSVHEIRMVKWVRRVHSGLRWWEEDKLVRSRTGQRLRARHRWP